MNAQDAVAGCKALIPKDYPYTNATPARFILQIAFMKPGSYVPLIKAPILFAICGKDSVAPPGPTLKYAKQAAQATIKWYDDMGHFDIYLGEAFEKAIADYIAFLQEHLPVKQEAKDDQRLSKL
jgi:fermentation-respiration switch protein FrsA (DUF1100 family)